MKLFGISLNRHSIPFLFLACSPIAFLLLRESFTAFWPSVATRAITVFLELGFIALATLSIANLKQWNISRRYSALLIIWLLWAGLSTVLGEHPWAGIVRWFELLISFIFGLFIYLLIQQSPQYKNLILYGIISALLFSLICYIGLWFALEDPYSYKWVPSSPFFNNIRHYGYFVGTVLPLGYWLLESHEKDKRLFAILYLSLSWGLAFWLGGRGALLGIIVATIIYMIISTKNIKWVLLSILIGAILSQFFVVQSGSLNLFHLLAWFNPGNDIDLNQISANRLKIYQDSISYWWSNAPILGTGADAFRYIMPSITGISQPHSIIIQLIFSYGLIGLIIPLGLIILLSIRQSKLDNRENSLIFLCIISAAIHALTDGVLYHAFGLFIVLILLTLSIPSTKKETQPLLKTTLLLSVLALMTYIIFSAQVVNSKNDSASDNWIEWNAKYPLYFSPEHWMSGNDAATKDHLIELALTRSSAKCWFYSRHSDPIASKLKTYCK